jgi:uncharacterized protein YutE (UPF0331/DUF86 family)
MDERILDHLKLLNRYELYLRKLALTDEETFVQDFILRGSAERYLQLALECCINVGNRILSLMQFEEPVATPETYAEIFTELAKLGAISPEFAQTMVQMVRFRNRLVHMYWDLDPRQIYRILKERLEDLVSFRESVINYLEHQPPLAGSD